MLFKDVLFNPYFSLEVPNISEKLFSFSFIYLFNKGIIKQRSTLKQYHYNHALKLKICTTLLKCHYNQTLILFS